MDEVPLLCPPPLERGVLPLPLVFAALRDYGFSFSSITGTRVGNAQVNLHRYCLRTVGWPECKYDPPYLQGVVCRV